MSFVSFSAIFHFGKTLNCLFNQHILTYGVCSCYATAPIWRCNTSSQSSYIFVSLNWRCHGSVKVTHCSDYIRSSPSVTSLFETDTRSRLSQCHFREFSRINLIHSIDLTIYILPKSNGTLQIAEENETLKYFYQLINNRWLFLAINA